MAVILNEDWTAEAVGRMHKYRISNMELAEKCGYTASYVSTVMNGGKAFIGDDTAEKTKNRILSALDELIAKRMEDLEDERNND